MIRPVSAACAAVLALAATAPRAAAQETVLPGYWESNESYSALSSLLNGASHDRKCLTAAQIEQFLAAPSTKHYRCTYDHHGLENGRAHFNQGACFSHAGRKVLSGVGIDGTYSPERFHLDFHYRYMLSPTLGVPGVASIDAHRISAECPADVPPGK